MKKILLTCAVAASALCANAQKVTGEVAVRVNRSVQQVQNVQVKSDVNVLESKTMKNGLLLQLCKDANGKTFKRILDNSRVKSAAAKTMAKAEGMAFAENFETGEMPESWTAVSKAEGNANPWTVTTPFSFFGDPGNEGNYACEAAYSSDYCDEWLITPKFSVGEDEQLVFLGLVDLFFMLDYTYLDWDTGEYSEKVPTAVLKIWATEDGGENWTLVKDYFEEACSMTYDELMDDYMDNGGIYTQRYVSLAQFAGKNIQLGFQYVGTDGNNAGIDDLRLAKPIIECSYEFPLSTPFFGISRQLMGMSASIPVIPVYQPVTWNGVYDKSIDGAFAYWMYYNTDSQLDFAIGDDLTTSYVTDYSSDFNARTNLYYPPTFCVSADGWTDGEFSKYTYFQAGARPLWEAQGELHSFGLSAYDPAQEGHTNASGPGGIAIFGTGEGVDTFWSNQLGTEGYLSAVSNICYTPETPIAFREIYTQAKASGIDPDATYTLDIRPVTDGGTILPAIASATIKGSDAFVGLQQTTATYYTFNFDFGQTIVLDKETVGENRYMIVWGGLHNSADELAPMQSYWESQKGINHGFIWLETTDGQGAILPMNQYTGTKQGFGIMIDGWYPWLEAAETTVSLGAGNKVEIALDSYYKAEELTLDVPAGLEATVVANEAPIVAAEHQPTLVVENKGMTEAAEIVITAPGVSKTIQVESTATGIAAGNLLTSGSPAGVYNLQGVKMEGKNLPAGIYLMKNSDGTTHKTIVK